jgi:hypothetical protein
MLQASQAMGMSNTAPGAVRFTNILIQISSPYERLKALGRLKGDIWKP